MGSDILAGLLATKLHESERVAALIDLGTNGEIVVGNRERMLCASTAAGPAFEGARISMGMRAATGAISEVRVRDGQLRMPRAGQCGAAGDLRQRAGGCGGGGAGAGLDFSQGPAGERRVARAGGAGFAQSMGRAGIAVGQRGDCRRAAHPAGAMGRDEGRPRAGLSGRRLRQLHQSHQRAAHRAAGFPGGKGPAGGQHRLAGRQAGVVQLAGARRRLSGDSRQGEARLAERRRAVPGDVRGGDGFPRGEAYGAGAGRAGD